MIQLVDARPQHAEAWHRWRAQPAAVQNMPLEPASVAELTERIASASSDLQNRSSPRYIWFVTADEQLVGMTGLTNVSWSMGYAEITYIIDQAYHQRGIGTQAVRTLVDRVFRDTDLVRLIAIVSRGNTASQKLLQRVGFRDEGVLRQHYVIGGRRVDQFFFGLLRAEWSSGSA